MTGFENAIQNYKLQENNESFLVDDLQKTLKCCGFNETQDWIHFYPQVYNKTHLPLSCCHDSKVQISRCSVHSASKTPCKTELNKVFIDFKKTYYILVGIMFALVVTQLYALYFVRKGNNIVHQSHDSPDSNANP